MSFPFEYTPSTPIFSGEPEEIVRWCEVWKGSVPWSKLDWINTTAEEIMDLFNTYGGLSDFGSRLFENPPLPEFVMKVLDTEIGQHSLVCYRKSVHLGQTFELEERNGVHVFIEPYIDAYVHGEGSPRNADFVISMGRCKFMSADNRILTTSYSEPIYGNNSNIDIKDALIIEISNNFKLAYMCIQMLLLHRPTVFTKSIMPISVMKGDWSSNRKQSKKKNQVRMVRVMRLDTEELQRNIKVECRKITCPSWGVIGHYRTYKKSGKRVWIAPYRKGRDRNNPSAYKPKEYVFVEEVESNA